MSGPRLIHVIDDDDAVRDGLAALFAAAGHAVRTYPSAVDFLEKLPSAGAGCVVTDVQMPQMSGLELLQRLSGARRDLAVIVLTGRADVPIAVEALKGGAADFIEKPFESEAVLQAVERALAQLDQRQARTQRQSEYSERLASLSQREREVLDGLVGGASNKEIARALEISPRTVETYRANIMMKARADSLSELVRMMLISEDQT